MHSHQVNDVHAAWARNRPSGATGIHGVVTSAAAPRRLPAYDGQSVNDPRQVTAYVLIYELSKASKGRKKHEESAGAAGADKDDDDDAPGAE
jgi:hypothetical protein